MQIDIWTDRYEHVGVADKCVAHHYGLWHRVFSCLVINPTSRKLFLQRKHPGQYAFDRPDYIEPVSAGGHYVAGESIEQGIRELHEELGLVDTQYNALQCIGVRQTRATIAPNYVEAEFQHLHILGCDLTLEGFSLGNAEVSGIVELDIADACKLFGCKRDRVDARYLTWPIDSPQGAIVTGEVQYKDLIPGYMVVDQLYLRLALAAARYCDGDGQDLLW